jgi:threonine dehydratase
MIDVEGAVARVRRFLRPTPVVYSEPRGAFLKLENLQVTGSYKVRGALNAIAAHPQDRRPVVAASAGNHAKGVAWAARRFGLQACVVVPENAPKTKVDGAAALGARVVRRGETFEEAFAEALRLGRENGWRFLHAFDDPDVIAGQATVGAELADAEADTVLVPIGGGGLAVGVALALRGKKRVFGVRMAGPNRVADGVRVKALGRLTRPLLAELLDGIILVTEDEVRRAMQGLLGEDRIVVEGAGALAPAALPKVDGVKVAIVSGGNVDLATEKLTPRPEVCH